MRRTKIVEAEFTRQAESFRGSATLRAADVTARVGEALGPAPGSVLDVACGPGLLIPTLAERATSVVGVDLTRKNLLLARESRARGPVQLVRGLAEELPFATASFDAVVLRLALHHFPRPDRALAAARSVLRAGGRLVVLDVLAPEDPEARELRDAIERLRDPSHAALLSRQALAAQLAESGFAIREQALWSQPRQFSEWAAIVGAPRRMADLEQVLRALCRGGGDPAGLALREEGAELWFTYDWGLFVADAA